MTDRFDLDLENFGDPDLAPDFVLHLAADEAPARALHFGRLWSYYRNDLSPLGTGLDRSAGRTASDRANLRPYVQAQEFGLPARITGRSRLGKMPCF